MRPGVVMISNFVTGSKKIIVASLTIMKDMTERTETPYHISTN